MNKKKNEILENHFWNDPTYYPILIHLLNSGKNKTICISSLKFPQRSPILKLEFEKYILNELKISDNDHYIQYPIPILRREKEEIIELYSMMRIEILQKQLGGGIEFKNPHTPLSFFFKQPGMYIFFIVFFFYFLVVCFLNRILDSFQKKNHPSIIQFLFIFTNLIFLFMIPYSFFQTITPLLLQGWYNQGNTLYKLPNQFSSKQFETKDIWISTIPFITFIGFLFFYYIYTEFIYSKMENYENILPWKKNLVNIVNYILLFSIPILSLSFLFREFYKNEINYFNNAKVDYISDLKKIILFITFFYFIYSFLLLFDIPLFFKIIVFIFLTCMFLFGIYGYLFFNFYISDVLNPEKHPTFIQISENKIIV